MPLFRSKRVRDKFNRWFTMIFLVIFVLAIAGGLIAVVSRQPAQAPGTTSTSTP